MNPGDSPPLLSHTDAIVRKAWNDTEQAFNNQETVSGIVIGKSGSGLRIDLNGIEAFMPGSQIASWPVHDLDSWKGREIEARVIKFSRRRKEIVLSRKILADALTDLALSQIEIGNIVEGTIKRMAPFGAFVDIGGGIEGLLHATEMSWERVSQPRDIFGVGDILFVKIINIDRPKRKISLSYKQLIPNPSALE